MAVAVESAQHSTLPDVAAACSLSGWLDQSCASSTYVSKQWDDDTRCGDFIFTANEDGSSIGAAATRSETIEMAKMYLGPDTDPKDPRASVVYADTAALRHCCPLLLQCGSEEVTLGDTTRMMQLVLDAGVDATLEIWPRMWHDWVMYSEGCGGAKPLQEAQVALQRAATFLRSHCTSRSTNTPVAEAPTQESTSGDKASGKMKSLLETRGADRHAMVGGLKGNSNQFEAMLPDDQADPAKPIEIVANFESVEHLLFDPSACLQVDGRRSGDDIDYVSSLLHNRLGRFVQHGLFHPTSSAPVKFSI